MAEEYIKATKSEAGYLYIPGIDYRCDDCWKFLRKPLQCAEFSKEDLVRAEGYCKYFGYGDPPHGLRPQGSYTPEQALYGELDDGTLCRNCEHFSGKDDCRRVKKDSPGDTPGIIHPDGCCDLHRP